jgi:hypothetical protein
MLSLLICSCGHPYYSHKHTLTGSKESCLVKGCECKDFEAMGI